MKHFHFFKGVFRSIAFSSFEASYTYLDNSFGKTKIPYTYGVEIRVVIGAFCAGTSRALIESPLEYAKVRFFQIKKIQTKKSLVRRRLYYFF